MNAFMDSWLERWEEDGYVNVGVSGLSPPTTDVCRTDQINVNGYLTLWHRKCDQYESDREALSRESSLESGETCDG